MTATSSEVSASDRAADPAGVVKAFLFALQAGELDQALELLDENVTYINVTLPRVSGRRGVERLFRLAYEKLDGGFRVHFHAIAAEGDTVLTDRTDELVMGRVRQRIWVYGRFEVADGKITLWRDSFDWLDVLVGLIRGIAGAFVPALNRPWPGDSAPT
jgi:limonene-1,2-epoxide hydrolase